MNTSRHSSIVKEFVCRPQSLSSCFLESAACSKRGVEPNPILVAAAFGQKTLSQYFRQRLE